MHSFKVAVFAGSLLTAIPLCAGAVIGERDTPEPLPGIVGPSTVYYYKNKDKTEDGKYAIEAGNCVNKTQVKGDFHNAFMDIPWAMYCRFYKNEQCTENWVGEASKSTDFDLSKVLIVDPKPSSVWCAPVGGKLGAGS
ncbi:hypothetical protein FQN50_009502 [Emmonsiellopsis sp. PD_5]|nr:hypothetical protein FQN50_009502 [Emmonsiellopsis sp. PD_5]